MNWPNIFVWVLMAILTLGFLLNMRDTAKKEINELRTPFQSAVSAVLQLMLAVLLYIWILPLTQ